MNSRELKKEQTGSFSFLKIVIYSVLGYKVLYFGLLGLCPPFYHLYLKTYYSAASVKPKNAPKQIMEAKEVFGIHEYKDLLPLLGDEVIIFRNYTDCANKFDKVLYPRHKEQIDSYREVEYNEKIQGNVYVPGVFKGKLVSRTLSEILKNKSPNEYASFLRIFDEEDYREIMNTDDAHAFKLDSSFISYFKRPLVSTQVHAAPLAQTLSVQCYGKKSWLFWKSRDLEKHGIYTDVTPYGILLNGSPDSILKTPTYRAVVNPNDLLYFPPFYYHAVASSSGKNVMFAIRKIDFASMKMSISENLRGTILFALRNIYQYINAKQIEMRYQETDENRGFTNIYENFYFKQREEDFGDIEGFADFNL